MFFPTEGEIPYSGWRLICLKLKAQTLSKISRQFYCDAKSRVFLPPIFPKLSGEVGDYETHLTDKYLSEEFDKWMEEELSTTTKGGFKFKFSDK